MTKVCDNLSVGVIIRDTRGNIALLKRAKFPVGISPVAGHIDDHGSPEQAARDEASEEMGLTVSELEKTNIYERLVHNMCRREGGDHHTWYVYETTVADTTLRPSEDETKGASWYDQKQLQAFADRTKAYHEGKTPEAEWVENPGLEDVWLAFLSELGYITV